MLHFSEVVFILVYCFCLQIFYFSEVKLLEFAPRSANENICSNKKIVLVYASEKHNVILVRIRIFTVF